MNRTIRRYFGAILAGFPIALPLSPVWGSGTGAGTGDPQRAWEWCMREATKAAVWYGKLPAEQGVADAYRTCRSDFKVVLEKIPEAEDQSAFRRQIEADCTERVNFARRMIELGNPHEQ